MDRKELEKLSTFDLAFNIATNKYNETDKFIALDIIKSRDLSGVVNSQINRPIGKKKILKKPLKGSKAEKILALVQKGKTAKEIMDELIKKKIRVYYPEIYRVIRNYTEAEE